MNLAKIIETAAEQLDTHRWTTMGIGSVECECGEIVHGDASLTRFPADAAFRQHMAVAVIDAVLPLIAAAEREPLRRLLDHHGDLIPADEIRQLIGNEDA